MNLAMMDEDSGSGTHQGVFLFFLAPPFRTTVAEWTMDRIHGANAVGLCVQRVVACGREQSDTRERRRLSAGKRDGAGGATGYRPRGQQAAIPGDTAGRRLGCPCDATKRRASLAVLLAPLQRCERRSAFPSCKLWQQAAHGTGSRWRRSRHVVEVDRHRQVPTGKLPSSLEH